MRKIISKLFNWCAQRKTHSFTPVQIEAPRLNLREMRIDDTDDIYNITQQDGFEFHYFDGGRSSVEKFIEKCIHEQKVDPKTGHRDNVMLAVEEKISGKLIGFASVETVHYEDGTITREPNFFMDPAVHNKGYGREAVINVMKYVFDHYGVNSLNATIEEKNKPSLSVAMSEGYIYTGNDASFDTNHGRRTYMVLSLSRETFYEKRANDKRPLILEKSTQDKNIQPPAP